MGVRGIHDELSYFTPNMTTHFQASSPSTPMSGMRSKVSLGHSHCSILDAAPAPPPASGHLPTSTFRLPMFPHPPLPPSQQLPQHHTYSNAPAMITSDSGSKTIKGSIFATPSSSKPINLGYFHSNSPRVTGGGTSRRPTTNINSTSACITNNNHQSQQSYNGNLVHHGTLNTVLLGDMNGHHVSSSSGGSSSGGSSVSANVSSVNPNNCNSSQFAGGVGALTFMKSSGMSSSAGCGLTYGATTSGGCSSASSSAASSMSNSILGTGPLTICAAGEPGRGGGERGESNYYAATDLFQVADKHFDRFWASR